MALSRRVQVQELLRTRFSPRRRPRPGGTAPGSAETQTSNFSLAGDACGGGATIWAGPGSNSPVPWVRVRADWFLTHKAFWDL